MRMRFQGIEEAQRIWSPTFPKFPEEVVEEYLDSLPLKEAGAIVDGAFAALRSPDFGIERALRVIFRLLGTEFVSRLPRKEGEGEWEAFLRVYSIPRRTDPFRPSATATERWWFGVLTKWVRKPKEKAGA